MKPREMFGLVNRIIGLIVALYGIDWLARFVLGSWVISNLNEPILRIISSWQSAIFRLVYTS